MRKYAFAIFILIGGALTIVLFLRFGGEHKATVVEEKQGAPQFGTVQNGVDDSVAATQESSDTTAPATVEENTTYNATLSWGNHSMPVTIADTEVERELGLSYTKSLTPRTGKLFIFEKPGTYGFWMKDMNYSLDMVWIDKNLKVVSVSKNVAPETYPEAFYPRGPVLYVLEINANEADQLELSTGTQLTLKK